MKLTKQILKKIIKEETQKLQKKGVLKEGFAWDRKFGESLPTLADTAKAYAEKNKLKEDSMSPSFRRMWNALDNVIPMVFPDTLSLADSNNPIRPFKQMLQVGDVNAIKEWPKVEKWINKKFKDIKLKKIKDDQQMLKVLSNTAKGMKV